MYHNILKKKKCSTVQIGIGYEKEASDTSGKSVPSYM